MFSFPLMNLQRMTHRICCVLPVLWMTSCSRAHGAKGPDGGSSWTSDDYNVCLVEFVGARGLLSMLALCVDAARSLKSLSWTSCHSAAAAAASVDARRRPSSQPNTATTTTRLPPLTVPPLIDCQLAAEQRRRAISAGLLAS